MPTVGELERDCSCDEQGYYKKGIHNSVAGLLESRIRLNEFADFPYIQQPADAGPNAYAEAGCAVPDCRRIAMKNDVLCAKCSALTQEPEPAQRLTVWNAVRDPSSGNTYYYNTQTQATQWEVPPGFATSEV